VQKTVKSKKHFWIYILECSNKSFYTGYTADLAQRFRKHRDKSGGKFTRSFKPGRIARSWKLYDTRGTALKVEHFIKKQNRAFKESIVKKPALLKKALLKELNLDLKLISQTLVTALIK
jgi:putative endonuclease